MRAATTHAPRQARRYVESFNDLIAAKAPTTPDEEIAFERQLHKIYDRHAPTLLKMARGVHEFKLELKKRQAHAGGAPAGKALLHDFPEVHHFLDSFYVSRIGIRILIGQYLELHHPQEVPHRSAIAPRLPRRPASLVSRIVTRSSRACPPVPPTRPPAAQEHYVGLIHTRTSPSEIAAQAIEDARYMCVRQYGDAPDVEIKGRLDLVFSYIPSHLYYMLFEARRPRGAKAGGARAALASRAPRLWRWAALARLARGAGDQELAARRLRVPRRRWRDATRTRDHR